MKGEWLGDRAPYGYANNKANKSLIVRDEEAAIVRRVFAAHQTGKGSKTIAEELNRAGITHRGGKKWYGEAVLRLLEGDVYAGFIAHGGDRYPGLHEAIVSAKAFAAVEANRATRNTRERAMRPVMGLTDYVLTGECGGSMVGSGAHGHGGSYRYYTCNLQTKCAECERCRNERVAADELEASVTSYPPFLVARSRDAMNR